MKNLHATISNRPTQEFEGSIGVTAGEYEQIGVTAVLSGPLSDQVQARLAGYFNNDSGYIDNSIGKDKRADDTISVRAMLNVDFNDDSSLLLIGQHTDIDTRGGVFHSRASKIDASGESVFCSPGDTDCGTFSANQPVGTNGFFYGGGLYDPANQLIDDGDGDINSGAFDREDSGVDREASNITAIFKTTFGNGSVAAQLSAYYSGKQYFNVVNAEVTEGGDYVIADASLTYYSPSEALEVSLFVHNFTDEEPLTYSYDITGFGNYTIQTFGPPRWLGGRVKYSF